VTGKKFRLFHAGGLGMLGVLIKVAHGRFRREGTLPGMAGHAVHA
jgi:hypothetical protein